MKNLFEFLIIALVNLTMTGQELKFEKPALTDPLAVALEMQNLAIDYEHLRKENHKKALAFFTLNTTNYPGSSNAFDSLGEVYMLMGDNENAIQNYKKSLALDSSNENAKEMIRKLE